MFDATWLTDNNSLKPTDVGAKVEGYATYNTNGTGPFVVESRVPDSKTVLVENPAWWDKSQTNIDRIEFIADHLSRDTRRRAAVGRDRLHRECAAAGSSAPGRPSPD